MLDRELTNFAEMEDVSHDKCQVEGCSTLGSLGHENHQPTHCATHKTTRKHCAPSMLYYLEQTACICLDVLNLMLPHSFKLPIHQLTSKMTIHAKFRTLHHCGTLETMK